MRRFNSQSASSSQSPSATQSANATQSADASQSASATQSSSATHAAPEARQQIGPAVNLLDDCVICLMPYGSRTDDIVEASAKLRALLCLHVFRKDCLFVAICFALLGLADNGVQD